MGRSAFENAVTVLMALGGSTNAIVHLMAMAGRAQAGLTLDDFDRISRADSGAGESASHGAVCDGGFF
jgi:dihydroxy-acid dehydratase